MDKERVRRFMDESKRRASFTIDPAQIFIIGSAKIEDATFGKRYIFHDGEIWCIESLDDGIARCCEITMGEMSEVLTVRNAAIKARGLTSDKLP